MGERRFDVIIVGAGIAGLGVGAILAKEGKKKVVVLDRYQQIGGRLMSYRDYPKDGWQIDVGLHMIELGNYSSAHALSERVGKEIKWGPFSESVQIFHEGKWKNVAELIPLSKEQKKLFRKTLEKIASIDDDEIEDWDIRSWDEWLKENVKSEPIRELFIDFGMIMTTISDPKEMAAGEILYIARENLRKKHQLLTSSYPIGGMKALVNPLKDVIEESGGEIRLNRPVEEVLIRNGKAIGVNVSTGISPYPDEYRIPKTIALKADMVVCALPIYQLSRILDLNPKSTPFPEWWINRIKDVKNELTGLIGYMIGLSELVIDEPSFFSALKLPRTQLPLQCFPASNFDPAVAPKGKQLLHTDVVCEYQRVSDRFERRRILEDFWEDLKIMFPDIDKLLEWKIPYYVIGCDGLARKPGLVGRFKPPLKALGVEALYFAGDTYIGRGLATNGAARSAMQCADLVLRTQSKK